MQLLQTLTQTPSVPGRESRIRKVIQNYLTEHGLLDEVTVDAMGSIIGLRKARPARLFEHGRPRENWVYDADTSVRWRSALCRRHSRRDRA